MISKKEFKLQLYTNNNKSYSKETVFSKVTYEEGKQVPFLFFECFEPYKKWLKMAFSTKFGGVSTGHLAELNLGWDRGDDRETVLKNYQLAAEELGIDYQKIVLSDQVHQDKVQIVSDKETAGREFTKKVKDTDGLICNLPGITLATSYADCVPLFFVDTKQHIVASSHSGWRGTVSQIGKNTIKTMIQQFGSKPEDIICLIGPSICQDCYEVSEDVVDEFKGIYSVDDMEEIVKPGKEPGKYQLDLWAACYKTLKKAGVPVENIQVSRVCTCCNHDILFSHRYTKGKRGNLNGFIGLCEFPEVAESSL